MRRGEARGWEAAESHAESESHVFTKSPTLLPLCSGAARTRSTERTKARPSWRLRHRTQPPKAVTVLEEMQAGTRGAARGLSHG